LKKWLYGMIAAFVVLNAVSLSALAVEEGSFADMNVSDEGVAFIKKFEGFEKYVYNNSSGSYIGYGTKCASWEYPDGISEETAETLMRNKLAQDGAKVKEILTKHGVTLTQCQYDAIMSFTYTIGTSWMDPENRIYSYIKTGIQNYSDVEIVNAIGIWCHQGKKADPGFAKRRIAEARMFLYGDYGDGSSPDYKYLILNAGDGEAEYDIYYYECGKPYGALPAAVLAGHTLAGWYTLGGTKINAGDIVTQNQTVSARWTVGTGPVDNGEEPVPSGTTFSDVEEADWYYPFVTELSQFGIISGYDDGTFLPDKVISGGEALKLILLASGYGEQAQTGGSHWASTYLDLAVENNLVAPGVITDLNAPISRLLIAQIAAKAIGLPAPTAENPFSDTADSSVIALYEAGVVQGSDGANGTLVYNPDENITRAQISAIIWRIAMLQW
jgi:GH24 family phage-related lysozyme (muramidase)